MATNVTVYDLVNYPDNGKTVTVDQLTVVPVGYEGDEQWVMSFITTAYSNNTDRTVIQDIYVQDIRSGWFKSSGLVTGPYVVSSGAKTLGIQIDSSASPYYVQLTEGVYGGDSLADELEDKIRAIPTTQSGIFGSDDALAYKNAMVEYKDNKFYIVSGNFSSSYTGTYKSAVQVTASGADTLFDILGFDLGTNSEDLAGTAVKETLVAVNYTAGAASLYVTSATGLTVGDCVAVTNGSTTDYTPILAISGTILTVPTVGTNGFAGIGNNYDASVSKVQLLRLGDPDAVPAPYHYDVDSIVRWGIMSIANQIDYSS
jgi:hypothetical protein